RIGALDGIAGAGVGGANELFALSSTRDASTTPVQYASQGMHFDGLTWETTELARGPLGAPGPGSVHALRPGEAMIVGGHGYARYYRNGQYVPVETGVTADLLGVWGPDADHLWVIGRQGTLLRWDRANPTVMTPDTTFPATTDDLVSLHG